MVQIFFRTVKMSIFICKVVLMQVLSRAFVYCEEEQIKYLPKTFQSPGLGWVKHRWWSSGLFCLWEWKETVSLTSMFVRAWSVIEIICCWSREPVLMYFTLFLTLDLIISIQLPMFYSFYFYFFIFNIKRLILNENIIRKRKMSLKTLFLTPKV